MIENNCINNLLIIINKNNRWTNQGIEKKWKNKQTNWSKKMNLSKLIRLILIEIRKID